jgi:hypothetical protein
MKWINRPPYNFSGNELKYVIVPDVYKELYMPLLSDKPYYILNKDEYQKITNENSEKKYTLIVRAVYTNAGGIYRVTQSENKDILVKYYLLGNGGKPKKDILLLELDEIPNIIYISYTVAK